MGKDYATWGLAATNTGIALHVRVQPRASRNAVLGPHAGATRIALIAPPVEGAANAALLTYLAEMFGVGKRSVTLVRGHTARAKLVRVDGISLAQALGSLHASLILRPQSAYLRQFGVEANRISPIGIKLRK